MVTPESSRALLLRVVDASTGLLLAVQLGRAEAAGRALADLRGLAAGADLDGVVAAVRSRDDEQHDEGEES